MISKLPVPLTLVLALACAGTEIAPPAAPTPILDAYTRFLAAGCPADSLDSPVEARVLRNTAFARMGRSFESPELRALYGNDGGWYRPAGEGEALPEADAACVARLQKHEAALRRSICVDAKEEAALLASPEAYLWTTEVGLSALFYPSPRPPRTPPQFLPFDACGGKIQRHTQDWEHKRYKFAAGRADSGPDLMTFMRPEIYLGLEPAWNTASDDALARLGAGVQTWRAVAETDYHPAQEDEWFEGLQDLRCAGTGPFMGEGWICALYSLP